MLDHVEPVEPRVPHRAGGPRAHRDLRDIVADPNKRMRFYSLPTVTTRRRSSLAEHRAIMAALRDRDVARAPALIAAHIVDPGHDAARAVTAPTRTG